MGTTFRTLPTAPAVRKITRTRVLWTLTADGWEGLSKDERRRFPTAPAVRVGRCETVYRTPIGTRGERSAVTFTVTGSHRNEYIRDSLPTIRVTSDDGTTTFGVWYY